jgi:hypothetical protein
MLSTVVSVLLAAWQVLLGAMPCSYAHEHLQQARFLARLASACSVCTAAKPQECVSASACSICTVTNRSLYCHQPQECVSKARAALSPQLLAAAMAAAAVSDGITEVPQEGAGPASPRGPRSPAAAAAAAGFEDRALTRREEASLLHPLLRLRQACCHPQV